ncbi:MAG: AlpA family phage regulatory protein [Acidobacteria bacterium]|nr:AlpA family phage regulatory protein [Acidobacteriota bacterium]
MSEHDRDRLLTRAEVERRVHLSRASVYRLVARGEFPAPLRVGPRAVRWRSYEIGAWISSRPRTREVARGE